MASWFQRRRAHPGEAGDAGPEAPQPPVGLPGGGFDDGKASIDLSLISHTNVGKTTLARTLLRRDVGEVLDQAHVTDRCTAYPVVETPDARLVLWDTPGFGDSARLVRRLRGRGNPVGWFVAQVWDRLADRPLWSSQQAARHVREVSEVVLYLVNAAEDPADAGYVDFELELLTWIDRPVLLLLNQTGTVSPGSPEAAELERRWAEHVADRPIVKDTLQLDAFTRSWVQETELLRRIEPLLAEEKRPVLRRLAEARDAENRRLFEASMERLGRYLARAARDREALSGHRARRGEKRKAMAALAERLETETQTLMDALIELHQLEGRSTAGLAKNLEDYLVEGTSKLTVEQSAILGSAVAGALGGLAADFVSGGLTFGGGAVAGAILGALGGAGLTRAYELAKLGGEPAVSWSPAFLEQLTQQTLLRYLAVAHYGRGRGDFRDLEHPRHWQDTVATAVSDRADRLARLWKKALKNESPFALPSRQAAADPPDAGDERDRTLARRITEVLREAAEEGLFQRRSTVSSQAAAPPGER